MTINFKVPDLKELKPRITVFGVGGAGGNAVNNMIESGLEGVDFVVANTDSQALAASAAERRVQMGIELTEGLGAGSHPEIGRSAAEEVLEEIKEHLSGSHMVFITAGMGGGTGTGAAPVIARAAREKGILTVGVVTKPFQFEGQRRQRTAEKGIDEMQHHVDTLIVIPNQNLFRVANEKTTFADAFAMADQVLYSGVACITDLIVKEGLINLDFADVRAVMSEMGKAMMGTGEASGEKRAIEAAEAAISNPLLDDVSMRGARGLLISITGGNDLTLYEVDEAASRIREEVDPEANIILGATFDDSLEGVIRVSVVATGIDAVELALPETASVVSIAGHLKSQDEVRPAAAPAAKAGEAAAAASKPEEAEGDVQTASGVTLRPIKPQSPPENTEDAAAVAADQELPTKPYVPPVAERPEDPEVPRMPRIEDFPLPGQNQLNAQQGVEPDLGLEAQKKKSGFFQKLANVGFGAREEDKGRAEPKMADEPARKAAAGSAMPAKASPAPASSAAASPPAANRTTQPQPEDDDHLEIPAFLRRQAN